MRLLITLSSLLLLASPAFAAPKVEEVHSTTNASKLRKLPPGAERVPNSYIVILKSTASRQATLRTLGNHRTAANSTLQISGESKEWQTVNGFAANLSGDALQTVLNNEDVSFVEEDGISALPVIKETLREKAPAPQLRTSTPPGQGVDIYSIDTGVLVTHTCFGGRARWGADFIASQGLEPPNVDWNGHGTHTSSTAAGVGYGPATAADVIAVKVINQFGRGSTSSIISGVDFVTVAAQASGKPSVAIMSLRGPASEAMDSAIRSSIAVGVHYAVAADNFNTNLVNTSPARVQEAVTVGALTADNFKASFSNFGPTLDVWYLGQYVTAAGPRDDNDFYTTSGTSMATPGVTGILAVAISSHGNSSPASLRDAMLAVAPSDTKGIPSSTTKNRAVLF